MDIKEEKKETKKLEEPKREINAWMLGFRTPYTQEFPEWKYSLRFIYWDWK